MSSEKLFTFYFYFHHFTFIFYLFTFIFSFFIFHFSLFTFHFWVPELVGELFVEPCRRALFTFIFYLFTFIFSLLSFHFSFFIFHLNPLLLINLRQWLIRHNLISGRSFQFNPRLQMIKFFLTDPLFPQHF